MGRIFETRKATMFARWDRMAKAFTRCGKEITIAVRQGGDSVESNPALRRAIQNARAVNMPKDKIQNAIDKALGVGGEEYQEVVYEGYAPHGVAVLVLTATDNTTRTVANVRMHFNKNDGNLGSTGSVAFMFDKMAAFRIDPEALGERDQDELELELIDHGLEQIGEGTGEEGEDLVIIRGAFTEFGSLQSALEERGIEVKSSGVEYIPNNVVELPDDQAEAVLKLIDKLEQDDDVQHVFHNLG
ncbi:MAG: YebC/PmpR family DNA-binding transcriptional regulator [Alphaproteobacteria bacterium]|nr:YebC/PmpR family DNA-binding transcriptional regulator [Alphaproteobacteria bacterium]